MSIATDFQKVIGFLATILTKTAAVDKTIVALAPTTKAAILATFYDVVKTVTSASAAAADASAGNITGAITLSSATVGMIQTVIADGKTDLATLSGIVTALKADV